jgi:hypothetical protein
VATIPSPCAVDDDDRYADYAQDALEQVYGLAMAGCEIVRVDVWMHHRSGMPRVRHREAFAGPDRRRHPLRS